MARAATRALALLLALHPPALLAQAGPPRPMTPALPRETPADVAERALNAGTPVADFAEALRRAYWTNPDLLAERARLRGADFRVAQARALSGPSLGYSLSYGYQRDSFEQPTGSAAVQRGWSTTASAILSQPVATFGRNAAAEAGAEADVAFRRAALRAVEQDVLLGAVDAYVGVIRDRAGVGIAQDNLDLLERELRDNRTRLNAREVTISDLQQVETRVELGRAQLLSARRAAASSEARFLAVVGAPPGALAQPAPLAMPVRTIEDAYAQGDTANPVIAAAYARERTSRARWNATKADLLPRVDLRGRADHGGLTPYSDSLRQTSLRGEVVVTGPIFESGLRQARVSEAAALNDADWRLIDAALRENRAETADAWNEWLAQSASIERYRQAVESARRAYDGALLQERAGLRTTLDVLDLARELLLARSNLNAASAAAYVAQARLLAAIGTLDHEWLFPDAPGFDPEDHYRRARNDGDTPLISPVTRTVDGLWGADMRDRPARDPAAAATVPGAPINLPAPQQGPPAP